MKIIQQTISGYQGAEASLTGYLRNHTPDFGLQTPQPAVIICPGGGYEHVSSREGEPVALRLLAAAIPAFVLTYSVAPAKYPTALSQLAGAVAFVRSHSKEWQIDPDKIIVAGFSAGGHLAASLGTKWWREDLQALGFDPQQIRPNGLLLSYPVITAGEHAHRGSFTALLGAAADEETLLIHSLERQVTKETPPTFIWHTVADQAVPVENTLLFMTALQKQAIPFEAHLFPEGQHGLSLADETTGNQQFASEPHVAGWFELAVSWIKDFF